MSLPLAQGSVPLCHSVHSVSLSKDRISLSSFPKGFLMLTTSETGQELPRFILADLSVRLRL